VIDEENLQQNAHEVGSYLLEGFASLRDKYPGVIGDVRGKVSLSLSCGMNGETTEFNYPLIPLHRNFSSSCLELLLACLFACLLFVCD